MDKYRIGDLVYAKLGKYPVVGTVVDVNEGMVSISCVSARFSRIGMPRRSWLPTVNADRRSGRQGRVRPPLPSLLHVGAGRVGHGGVGALPPACCPVRRLPRGSPPPAFALRRTLKIF